MTIEFTFIDGFTVLTGSTVVGFELDMFFARPARRQRRPLLSQKKKVSPHPHTRVTHSTVRYNPGPQAGFQTSSRLRWTAADTNLAGVLYSIPGTTLLTGGLRFQY